MAPQESKVFVPDSHPGLTTEKKNQEISGWLAQSPYVHYQIVRIERDEEKTGWWIYYIPNFNT